MPRLLLVDDEPELLQVLVIRLRAAGFICETAKDGNEALVKLEQSEPDLIVVDLVMPDMDGYELCQRLHAEPRTAKIPVIVLTAVPDAALKVRAAALGAVGVLHKPFDSHALLATIRAALDHAAHPGGTSHGRPEEDPRG